ncbi:MAG: hypothetical protein ABSG89_03170 [Bacteroidales bacterium]
MRTYIILSVKFKIPIINFVNSCPFPYGLTESGFERKITLTADHHADFAAKLISRKDDIGLVPIASFPSLNINHIFNYRPDAYEQVMKHDKLNQKEYEP